MKAITLLVLLLSFVVLSANLVESKPTEYIQPDGTVLSLFVSGDEYYHRVHDERGFTILQNPETGYAVYAVPDGNSIKASNFVVGTIDPASLGISPNLFKQDASIVQRYTEQQQLRTSGNRADPTGTVNNIVVFVRFSDQTEFPTTTTYTWYNNLFNSTSQQSLADFYDEVSSGQLDINTYLYSASGSYVLSVQVSHTRGYYSPWTASNPSGYSTEAEANSRQWGLFSELIVLTDPLVPAGIDVDMDNDSNIDALTYIIRGATDDWGDILWPAHVSWTGSLGTINGTPVWHYVKDFEGGLGASVICHEMGHMIGFPDLYHYTSNGITPIGGWSLMASDNAQHETAYEKYKYGTWFASLPTITATSTPTVYTLDSIETDPYACYKIASNLANAFYMVEYRGNVGRYEAGVPGAGLIVYRVQETFGGANIDGNAGGPPDELYVYRPGGDIDTNGTVDNAGFSSNSGRTKIYTNADPEPWLLSATSTQSDGNLVITDVTATGGTSISFTLRDSAPNIWDGSSSTAWNLAANWSLNHIPTVDEDVEIPNVTNDPVVSTSQSCRSVLVQTGAILTISTGTLDVVNNYTTFGSLVMNDATGNFYVREDLYFESGSTATISALADIYVWRNVEFRAGSSVNMANGNLWLYGGSGSSYVRTYAAATIYNLRSDKDATYISGISGASTAALTINGSIYVYGSSTFTHPYAGTTYLMGGLYVYSAAICTLGAGTIRMEGSSAGTLYFYDAGTGNYLNSLVINKSSGINVNLTYPIVVKGNLTITQGILQTNSNSINLGGYWSNSVGAAGFVEGTGSVILDGTGSQYIYSETFNTLVLNKSAGMMYILSGSTVNAAVYDWTAGEYTVSGGTFTVADLADSGIFGTITLSSGTINYTQDVGQYVDLRANLTISGGTFNVNGGSSVAWFSYVDIATLTMTSGVLDFKNQSIYIPSSYAFNDNISGGTIRSVGYFDVQRTDFNPTGGTIYLYGGTDAFVNCNTGSNFYSLSINKTSTREEQLLSEPEMRTERDGSIIPITRSNTVTANSNLTINNSLTISAGTFDASARTITVSNDLLIYGTLKMITAGVLDVGDDVAWYSGSISNVTTGTFYCAGNWAFNSGCSADLTGTTTYLDNPYGGSLTINSTTPRFGNLVINGTEETPTTTYNYTTTSILYVNGSLTINTDNVLNLNEGVCTVTGNTLINTNGQIQVGDGGTLTINGGLDLYGSLFTGPGTCTVHGYFVNYSAGLLSVVGGSFINDAAWGTGGSNVITLTCGAIISGGVLEITAKTFSIIAHATRTFSNATLRIGMGFTATAANCFQPSGGSLYMIGNSNPVLQVSGTNWINNLYIQKSGSSDTAYVQNLTTIKGSVNLVSGRLNANNYDLYVGGDWINSIGTSAYLPGTGIVYFNKAGTGQIVSGTTNFTNVTDQHTGSALDFEDATGISGTLTVNNIVTFQGSAVLGTVNNVVSTAILAFYYTQTYTIASYTGGGALRAYSNAYVNIADLTQNGLYGSFIASGAGHLEFHQDSSNWIDVNGNITIDTNGIVDIYGGSLDSYFAYNGNSVFTMSSGEFNIKNRGFYVFNNGYTGNFIVSGGTIRANGGWTDNWGIFDPTGGTVEMTGSADSFITPHASSWFWTLKVNKPLARTDGEPEFATDREGRTTAITRSGNLNLGTSTIKGGLTIQMANQVNLTGNVSVINSSNVTVTAGTLALNAWALITTGHVNIFGTLLLGSSSYLQIANAKDLNINSGGTLRSVGTSVLPAIITHNTTGYYGLNIESGGTIGANYTIFEYMNANGVYLKAGSVVDEDYSLDNCTFRLGASSGRLLMINNSQSFTVDGAVFPTNTWSGAYNVTKSLNSGIVYFDNWTGAFGGPTYEQDSYNHLYWEGFGIPPVIDLNISYVSATSRILLSWTYPLTVSYYKIYRSTTPYGTYSYHTSTLSNSWSQAVPGPKYYYKVTAVTP